LAPNNSTDYLENLVNNLFVENYELLIGLKIAAENINDTNARSSVEQNIKYYEDRH